MTWTDPDPTDLDLAAIAACREDSWPTADEWAEASRGAQQRPRDPQPIRHGKQSRTLPGS